MSPPLPSASYEPKRRNRQPKRRLTAKFPPLGHRLHTRFDTVEEAHEGVLYAQHELCRLEKSMAIFDASAELDPQLETIMISQVLGLLRYTSLITEDNLTHAHKTLVATLSALSSWCTAVIGDAVEAQAFEYVVSVSLKEASDGVKAISQGRLTPDQQKLLDDAISEAQSYITGRDALEDAQRVPTDADMARNERRKRVWKNIVRQGKDAVKDVPAAEARLAQPSRSQDVAQHAYEPKRRFRQPTHQISKDGFPSLGQKLPDEFETVDEAIKGVAYVQEELFRLERSMAIFGDDAGRGTFLVTAVVDEVLQVLRVPGVVIKGDLASVHRTLAATLSALAAWGTAVVDTALEAQLFQYAVMVSQKEACEGVMALSHGKVTPRQERFLASSLDVATGYIKNRDVRDDHAGVLDDTQLAKGNRRGSFWSKLSKPGKPGKGSTTAK